MATQIQARSGFRNGIYGSIILLAGAWVAAWPCLASANIGVTREMRGLVTHVAPESVTIRAGDESVTLNRDNPGAFPKGIGIGDDVDVTYRVDVLHVKVLAKSGQKPGTAPSPGENGKIILDDRAFFNAKNEAGPQ